MPDSGLDSLPFWPSTKWENANLDRVGSNWRQRLHGSLFFPWHFPISNNKLKLLAYHEGGGNGGLADVLADEKLVRAFLKYDQESLLLDELGSGCLLEE